MTGLILLISFAILAVVIWTIRYIVRLQVKKNLQQKLLAYQARLIEITSHAFISTDLDRIISWNKAAEELYGYTAAETIGQPILDIIKPGTSPEEQQALAEEIAQKGFWKGEVTHFHKNGSRIHLLLSVAATPGPQNNSTGYVLVSQDISERKNAEEQLIDFNRQLEKMVREKTAELLNVFERVSDAFMAFDKSGIITYVNEKAARLNKVSPDQLTGRCVWDQYPISVCSDFGVNFQHAMSSLSDKHFEMYSPILSIWVECFMYPSEDGLSLFFRDITQERLSKEIINRSSQELRQLASHLQEIREEERAAIAREIHDELGQQLTGIKMDLSWLMKRCPPPENLFRDKIAATLDLLDNTIGTVRRIATELRPGILDDLGLIAAIEWQSQEFQKRSGILAHFQSSLAEFDFTPAAAIGLFRICQESLTNVARHSGATQVWISLDWIDDCLILSIQDNGRGMSAQPADSQKTLGLLGMRERALMMGGSLEIQSPEDKGFTLEVTVPLQEPMYH